AYCRPLKRSLRQLLTIVTFRRRLTVMFLSRLTAMFLFLLTVKFLSRLTLRFLSRLTVRSFRARIWFVLRTLRSRNVLVRLARRLFSRTTALERFCGVAL